MSLSVTYGKWLSLSLPLSPVTWSCYMSFAVSSSSMELLHVSQFLVWLLVVSAHHLSGQLELQHVSYCLQLSLSVSHCFSNPME